MSCALSAILGDLLVLTRPQATSINTTAPPVATPVGLGCELYSAIAYFPPKVKFTPATYLKLF